MFQDVYQNKKVLITGDTGFKGSWLAIWLKMIGAEVFGYALAPKNENDNFVKTGLDTKITHRDGDVRDKNALLKYFSEVQPDFAFHLAAQPLVIDSYKDPHYTFETNLMGTVNFFEAIRKTSSVKVAVNVTSDKCYQNNEWAWGYRENDPMGGKDPYSASKGASEIITQSYLHSFFSETGSANIASARAGNVIGGGDWAENRIVPDFFRAIQNNESLLIRNPESTRPWQHVLEPLSGYLSLAMFLYKYGKEYSGGWNFGPIGDTNKSVRDLIEQMIKSNGSGSYDAPDKKAEFHEAGLLNLDISKAMHVLNWKPSLDFTETVELTVQGYQDESSNKVYKKRVSQIEKYVSIAANKDQYWTK